MKPDIYSIPPQKRRFFLLGLSALFSFVTAAVFFSSPAIGVLEWRVADYWTKKQRTGKTSGKVAVIGIDEAFLDEHGWPLEKDIYGDAVGYLTDMGAKAIAFDILFADNLDACGKEDSVFREITRLVPNIIHGFGILANDGSLNIQPARTLSVPDRFSIGNTPPSGVPLFAAVLPYRELLDASSCIGFYNQARPFADGIDRKIPLFCSQDSLVYPSLALASCCVYENHQKPSFSRQGRALDVGGRIIPIDENGYMYVNFTDSIPVYTMTSFRESQRVWLDGKNPAIGKEQLENRLVFIGNTALSLGDFGITPVSATERLGRSPNVMMHAYAASTILNGNALEYSGRFPGLVLSFLIVVVSAVFFYFLPAAQMAVLSSAILFGLSAVFGRMTYHAGYFVPAAEAISAGILFCITGTISAYIEKEIDRKYLQKLFGVYVSPNIIKLMYEKQERPALGGAEVNATAFFSDIESFSSFSEEIPPEMLIKTMNEYFETMTGVLLANNGTLDKFIGDAIVAFFGAPHPSHTNAYDACVTAVKMQEALAALRSKWQNNPEFNEKVRNLKMRIGINTGRFITGNIGCSMRMNYTMVGDTVNLASRLESAAKEYGVYTVIGEETYTAVRHDFRLRRLDKIRVKGRSAPVDIYQLMGLPRDSDQSLLSLIEAYDTAMKEYLDGNFDVALELFRKSLAQERYPELKNPSSVMCERTQHLAKIMPENWDGVFTMKAK
jgi:adenylate cyclase